MKARELLNFMRERHTIYLKKSSGAPKPWTKDSVLRNYKFTNVFRELDKTTVWLRENVREPYLDNPNMWFMVCMFRQIGWIPTMEELMAAKLHLKWNPKKAREIMLARKERGETVYTGAYMLNAHGRGPDDPADKAFFTTHLVLNPLWENRKALTPLMRGPSVEVAYSSLLPTHGWGPFTAYQVVLDLMHTPGWLWEAHDKETWCVTGPGARRGLNRVMGRELRHATPRKQELEEMHQLTRYVADRWPSGGQWGRITVHEVEFQLCEFDKYSRAKNGEGRPKAMYPGEK